MPPSESVIGGKPAMRCPEFECPSMCCRHTCSKPNGYVPRTAEGLQHTSTSQREVRNHAAHGVNEKADWASLER